MLAAATSLANSSVSTAASFLTDLTPLFAVLVGLGVAAIVVGIVLNMVRG